MKYQSTHCLSHKEDADGICSGALVRQATGASLMFTDYTSMIADLREIEKHTNIETLFICDLGLNKQTQDEFVKILTRLVEKGVYVTYIDHHQIDKTMPDRLLFNKVAFIHDIKECATVLVYDLFKELLSKQSALVAACASVTDYMEDSLKAAPLMEKFDRQFVFVNATAMTYYITENQNSSRSLIYLADQLSKDKFPCNIRNVFSDAAKQVSKTADMIKYVEDNLKTEKNLSHVYLDNSTVSVAVNFALGMSSKNVAISYRQIENEDKYAVSVRGRNIDKNLGKLVGDIAFSLGGLGGGHATVCGASVPKEKIMDFIHEFDHAIYDA